MEKKRTQKTPGVEPRYRNCGALRRPRLSHGASVIPRWCGSLNATESCNRLFEQGYKTGLFEMVIAGERLGEVVILHDQERNAVREGPFFVGRWS